MVTDGQNLSVLIAGCGSIGRRHARVLQGMGVRDLRACDPVGSQRDQLIAESNARAYASYEEALASRPDVVLLCTPTKMHLPMAHQALDAGAHIFCEKPLSDSAEGIDALAEHARRADRAVAVGYCYRHHDGLRKAKDILERGEVGRLVSLRCMMGEHLPLVRPDYRSLYCAQYGGAYELIHAVDLAVWYSGRPFQRVRCAEGTFSDIGIVAPDLAELIVTFEGGMLASIHVDFFQVARRFQVELICTAGIVTVEFGEWDRCVVSVCNPQGEWTRETLATARDDMIRAEDRAFLAAVAGGFPVECGIAEARKSLEIVAAGRRDALGGFLPSSASS